jgi:hypothetical protein
MSSWSPSLFALLAVAGCFLETLMNEKSKALMIFETSFDVPTDHFFPKLLKALS